ncbi:MAG: ETC complex I subunit [Alphaproteobacteria bacterium]
MQVRIYQPTQSAMQSGRGKQKDWLVEPCLLVARTPEPLMGWSSAGDTLAELRDKLRFATRAEAVAFAVKQGWSYEVEEPEERQVKPRNYLDNFRYVRPQDEERKAAKDSGK